MFDFRMPSLGADMEVGLLAAWHVKPGDRVKKGDVVADVETDKGTIEVEIWEPGEVVELLVNHGERVPVGTPLARFAELKSEEKNENGEKSQVTPAVSVVSVSKNLHTDVTESKHIRISPLARKVAKALQVDLARVQGTGPAGAVTREDVEKFSSQDQPTASKAKIGRGVIKELPFMRKAIGQAMARSKREIPHYYLKADVNMTKAMKWLKEQNERRAVTERLLPLVLGIKAMASAIGKVPEVNGYFVEGNFHPKEEVHLGLAIALRGGGLVAPAIQNVEKKNLEELMRNLIDLVQRARSGKLRSAEIMNPTITLTNLGETGVDTVFGVIHPPQVAMVGFGRIVERPWACDGMIGAVPLMSITLAADHRASDGHRGGIFLTAIDKLLQDPQLLLE